MRGALNEFPRLDEVTLSGGARAGALGLRALVIADDAKVTGTFKDGLPALMLANFQCTPVAELTAQIPLRKAPAIVTAMEKGALEFTLTEPSPKQAAAGFTTVANFALPLGWNDIMTIE